MPRVGRSSDSRAPTKPGLLTRRNRISGLANNGSHRGFRRIVLSHSGGAVPESEPIKNGLLHRSSLFVGG
jgi:hypothetical protein